MKRNISHLLYIVAIGFFTSCSDFLDVAPKDKVLEEDQYKTEAGIHGALNGLYRQLISTSFTGRIYLRLLWTQWGTFIPILRHNRREINCLPHCFSSVTDGPKSMEQLKAYLPIYGKADIIRFSISTIFEKHGGIDCCYR